MWNARLDEAQTGIKISGRNINNHRYADDTTLMSESKGDLKSLLMRVKEESEKAGLKLIIQKTKIIASGPITSWKIEGGKLGTTPNFPFYLPWSDGTVCHDLSFLNIEFPTSFFTLLFHLHQKAHLVSLHFLPLECYHLHIWGCWYFSSQIDSN